MFNKLKTALQSYYVVPCVFLFAFACWAAGLNSACICVLALLVSVILAVCDDVKNIFCPVLFAGFCVKDIVVEANWVLYIVCVCVAVAAFIACVVKGIIINKGKIRIGKLFFPLVALDVAALLGGIASNFQATAFLVTLGLSAAMLLLYFIAVNFTENLGDYLAFLFVCGAAFTTLQIFVNNVCAWQSIRGIFSIKNWATAEAPNTTAIFSTLGSAGCLYMVGKRKFGYLALIPCAIFAFVPVIICCRGVIITEFIVLAPALVITVMRSDCKKQCLVTIFALILAALVTEMLTGVVTEKIADVIYKIKHSGSSGRTGKDGLWAWCWNKFIENPVFGYGFVCPEGSSVPTIRPGVENYIHAHNTALQWLVSTGIVGIVLSGWFYFTKYKITLETFKKDVYLPAYIIIVAASGMVDQAAAMDPFVFLLPIVIVAAAEEILRASRLKQNLPTAGAKPEKTQPAPENRV